MSSNCGSISASIAFAMTMFAVAELKLPAVDSFSTSISFVADWDCCCLESVKFCRLVSLSELCVTSLVDSWSTSISFVEENECCCAETIKFRKLVSETGKSGGILTHRIRRRNKK